MGDGGGFKYKIMILLTGINFETVAFYNCVLKYN